MIDILLATYNGARFLKEQFDSILAQSYQDFKILVRDDGSKDETVQIIKEYLSKYPTKIVFIEDDKKCGSSAKNFMEIAKHSTAEYVMFSDQDDYWFKDKVEKSLEAVKSIEDKIGKDKPVLAYGSYKLADENLKEINDDRKKLQIYDDKLTLNKLLVQNYVTGCLMIVNKALCHLLGDYDDRIPMHDWWAAQIAAALGEVKHFDEYVMYYRQHGSNVVGSTNVKSFKYRFKKLFDKEVKKSHIVYKNQAELFMERFSTILGDDARSTINGFLDIFTKKNKFKRIRMLKKGKYLKSDFARRLGQYLYI